MLSRPGHDCTESEHELLRRHVEQCSICRAQFERLVMVASATRAIAVAGPEPDDHPGELELAVFAEQGCAADHADEIIEHLSRCRPCREAVSAAWAVAEEQGRPSGDGIDDRPAAHPSPLRRILCSLGAFAALVGELFLLGLAGAELLLAWLIHARGSEPIAAVPPPLSAPESALGLWTLIAACVVGALVLRWASGRLFTCARPDPANAAPTGDEP
ncbi:MAG: hypothetical protein ACLFU7_10205 [Armatimonadota bacterium]